MKIMFHIGVLYVIYFIGVWIQQAFHLFLPGSVIGMLILFLLLITNVIKLKWIEEGTKLVVDNLALFFIPVTVGIMNYYELFAGKGFLLIVIVLISTVFVMAGSGLIGQWLFRRREVNHD
ncbi:CidA/LrgA family protein [Ornithinibacillus xuwenensis]|uniref:CidA/LrgA family protein n=1 Tax=Ornithinibacillus xuwenensis TaxID=3144668 RepID=A0ABU9XFN1_9BACI